MLDLEVPPQPQLRLRRFASSFLLILACVASWSLAMPLFSAPDEGAHIVRAYAVVHGEQSHPDLATGGSAFYVPAEIVHGGNNDDPCFAGNPNQPASCMDLQSDGPQHSVDSSAIGYPPFYYFIVGWPTLLTSGLKSLYLIRLVGALVVALLIALGLESVVRLRRPAPLLLAATVAITPAVLYFGAMATPSGITIAAAFAVWTAGMFLARSKKLDRIGWAAARFGFPLCLFLLLRRDAVFWAALVIATIAVLIPRDRWRLLLRARPLWAWAVACAVCAGIQLLIAGAETGSSVAGQVGSTGGDFWRAVADASWLAQQIQGGILGWLDVNLPFPVLFIFVVSTGFLVISAIGFSGRRVSLALLGMTLAIVTIPLLLGTVRWPYLQGRYLLPFTVGLPLVAGLGLSEALKGRLAPRRFLWLLMPLVAFAQIAAFAQAMRRYVSGATAEWWIFSRPQWSPPAASPTVFVLFYIVAIAALFGWLYYLAIRTPTADHESATEDESTASERQRAATVGLPIQ